MMSQHRVSFFALMKLITESAGFASTSPKTACCLRHVLTFSSPEAPCGLKYVCSDRPAELGLGVFCASPLVVKDQDQLSSSRVHDTYGHGRRTRRTSGCRGNFRHLVRVLEFKLRPVRKGAFRRSNEGGSRASPYWEGLPRCGS